MTDELNSEDMARLEKQIGCSISEKELFTRALTHSSTIQKGYTSNERLEFLGDAILEVIVCHYLYHEYPDMSEGQLSEIRAGAVSTRTLSGIAEQLDLTEFARFSRGIEQKQSMPDSILANLFEAVVAAVYLEKGMEEARAFVLRHLEPCIQNEVTGESPTNYKTELQKFMQRKWNRIPHYQIKKETGPDHDKEFEVEVMVRGEAYGPGIGTSKQEAEQEAARIAAEELGLELD